MSVRRKELGANKLPGIPFEHRAARFRRDASCDAAWLKREVHERPCPACGGYAHVRGRRWRKVWHVPAHRFPPMPMVQMTHLLRKWSGIPWCAGKRDGRAHWASLAQKSGVPETGEAAKTLR